MINHSRYVPHVEEGSLIGDVLASLATTTALGPIPSIHAKRIDVILESNAGGNDVAVVLRIYGAAKTAFVDVPLGTTVAGNTDGYVHVGVIGQVYDVLITNTDGQGTAAAATYTVWTGARP